MVQRTGASRLAQLQFEPQWRMAVLVPEVEIEAGPIVVVRALGCWHPSPFQPPLEGYPGFSGNLLHRNIYG